MKIDRGRLDSITYGNEMAKQLKEIYIGQKIIDVTYNYFSESFRFVLENGQYLNVEEVYKI